MVSIFCIVNIGRWKMSLLFFEGILILKLKWWGLAYQFAWWQKLLSRFNCLSEMTTLVNCFENMESFQLFIRVYWSLEPCKINPVESIVRFCSCLIDHLVRYFDIMCFCKKMWNLEGVALLWLGLRILLRASGFWWITLKS